IWLCFGHAKKKADVINRYRIEEKQERGNWKSEKADYDVLEVVMVYPGTERREEENGMMGLLKELFCEGGEEKGKRLEEKYGILMTKEMEKEVDRMCNLSQIFVDKGIERGLVLGKAGQRRRHETWTALGESKAGRKQCGLCAFVVETPVDPL
ncbi:MAG: hypothetical protein ACLVJ6_10165, partial [Merdibacter sp.]